MGRLTEILHAPEPPMSMSMELLIVVLAVAVGIMLLIALVLAAVVIVPILLMAALDCMSMTCQQSASTNCHASWPMNRRVSPRESDFDIREILLSRSSSG